MSGGIFTDSLRGSIIFWNICAMKSRLRNQYRLWHIHLRKTIILISFQRQCCEGNIYMRSVVKFKASGGSAEILGVCS